MKRPTSAARKTPRRKATSSPRRSPPNQLRMIYVLSDSTGNLADHMLSAFLTQFPRGSFNLRRKTFLRTDEQFDQVFGEIEAHRGIVMHAVVSAPAKRRITRDCRRLGVPHCDLTGRFVEFLSKTSGLTPMADPQRLHRTDELYQRRIAAMEFTLEHDDALGLETLREADVVLAGVSRTSKTPTSIYLAQLGFRAGNVALAIEVEPPPQLLALPPQKVVGLLIDPMRLIEIRNRRQSDWRMSQMSYADQEHVQKEILWSKRLFHRQGWKTVDVTDQAIEETAARIVSILNLHPITPATIGANEERPG